MQTIKLTLRYLLYILIIMIIYSFSVLFINKDSFFDIILKLQNDGVFNLILVFSSLLITFKFFTIINNEKFLLRFENKDKFNNYLIKKVIFLNFLVTGLTYFLFTIMIFIKGNINFDISLYHYDIPNNLYMVYYIFTSFILINILCVINIYLTLLFSKSNVIVSILIIVLNTIPNNPYFSINIMSFFDNHLYDGFINEIFSLVVIIILNMILFMCIKKIGGLINEKK